MYGIDWRWLEGENDMYYGIERSTDLRDPQTVVKKFVSRGTLERWVKHKRFANTYADPEAAQNWHHTLRYGYELKGRINKRDGFFTDKGTPTYPLTTADKLGNYIRRYGEEIKL